MRGDAEEAMRRILVLVPVPLDRDSLARRQAQIAEADVGQSVEFEFRAVKVGPANFDSHHDSLLADIALTEAGLHAQDEGFDGVCVDTMGDSGVRVLRSLLDIPVVGPGRVSFLTALMLGNRFSVLTLWKPWAFGYEETLREMGLSNKCVSIRWPEGLEPDLAHLLEGKKAVVLPKLLEVAEACIRDGADVLCLGSTTMHEAHAYLVANLPIPVINPGPLSYQLVELLLALGLRQSSAAYPRPASPKLDLIEAMVAAARDAS
jgi:allantoin racemase